jgi:hypothetical protein
MASTKSTKSIEKKLAGVAATTKPAKNGKETPIIFLTDKNIESFLAEYVGLDAAIGFLEGPKKSLKERIEKHFLDLWLQTMWSQKTKPVNPRFATHKLDKAGKPSDVADCTILFQVQFQKGGLAKTIENLPKSETEKKTTEQRLKEYLVSDAVGVSQETADALLNPITGEFLFEDVTEWAGSFNDLLKSDGLARSAANKILAYLKAKPKGKDETVSIPAFTREEQEAVLVRGQVARIKDGFYDRAATYCETLEQLKRLIAVTNPKSVMSGSEFAVGDSQSQVWKRFEQLIKPHLNVTSTK